MERRLVVRGSDIAPYAPANHTGTANRRVICEETVGARKLEILIGTIQKGHGAQEHAHPQLEQLGYFLHGSGMSEVDGVAEAVTVGAWSFLPKGVFHRFTVTSEEPVQLIVVYAPPYGENRSLTVLPGQDFTPPPVRGRRAVVSPPVVEHDGTSVVPIIDRETVNAEHVEVHSVTLYPGLPLRRDANPDAEQVLYVQQGNVQIEIGGHVLQAGLDDWVFIPPGSTLLATALNNEPVRGFLLRSVE